MHELSFYHSTPGDIAKLLSLPETGMGFQVVSGIPWGEYTRRRYVAFNAQLFVELGVGFDRAMDRMRRSSFKSLLLESKLWTVNSSTIELENRSLIQESRTFSQIKSLIVNNGRKSGAHGALESQVQSATGDQHFVRLSAFADDLRIDQKLKRAIPGTFATTFEDYKLCVDTNDDPIDRYALPNDDEIKWAFYLRPKQGDEFQHGIVQPAFGHIGGGEEAYFHDGTSENTLESKGPYGT